MRFRTGDPFKLPGFGASLDTWNRALKKALHRPYLGVTQGGSSRSDRGAKPAATTAQFNPAKQEKIHATE